VQVFDNSGTFLTKWGSSGSGYGQFSHPSGIALDPSGNIYVADLYSHNFQLFTNTGTFLKKWVASTGEGVFHNAGGVATDSNGNVYVADTNNDRVQAFSNTRELLAKWGSSGSGDGQFSSPLGIAVDSSSNNVYVADTNNNRIQVFDNQGAFLRQWGGSGSGNGQFHSPQGVAVDGGGNVYVADFGNSRVQVFSSTGVFIRSWGSAGTGNSQFNGVSDIALGTDGTVYVTDNGSRVQVFSSTGTFLRKWGSYGTGDGQFKNPQALTVDAGDNVYVADTYNNRVQVFDSTGTFLGKWGSLGNGDAQFNTPTGIAADTAGNVYVADKGNQLVKLFQGACILTAIAGSAQTVEQTSCLGASVTLDGSGSVQAGACSGELSYSWSWLGGSATGVNPTVLMPPGTTHVTLTVTNVALTSTSSVDITVRDTLPPVTTAIITGTRGTNDWYVSDVNISLTATDACVKEIHYSVDSIETVVPGGSASFALVSEGTHSVSFYAVDNVNHIETPPHQLQIKIDKTLPKITPVPNLLPNANGWNNTDVTITFTCSDAVSGIVSCPTPTTVTTECAPQNITGTAVDAAGNTATVSVVVKIDKTPPLITTFYTTSTPPNAGYTVSDNCSGMASDSASGPTGGNTNGTAVYTYTVNAADKAGNTAALTAVYNQVFGPTPN
jgi:DNA-binding beta-propeller fold protein YncE